MLAVIRCPQTRREYQIDIPTSVGDVARLWRRTIGSACPHCGETHLDGYRQLYEGALFSLANLGTIRRGL